MMVVLHNRQQMGGSMNTITTAAGLVGVDLTKNVFSICEVNLLSRVLCRQYLRCEAFECWYSPRIDWECPDYLVCG